MQLTTITLATIFITSLATGSEASTFATNKAMFQELASKEAHKPSAPNAASKPTPPQTPGPSMGTFPPSFNTMGSSRKPTSSSASEPTKTSHPKPTPSPKTSVVAPTPTASKSSAEPESAPNLLPSFGTPLGTPELYREQSRVAELTRALQSPIPKPAPGTLPRSSVASKVSSIPEDKEFVNFKKAIEQGKYSDAMKIVDELPKEKSREPYAKYLATFDTSEILGMIASYKLMVIKDGGVNNSILYSKIIYGLFLMYANDAKFSALLRGLEHYIKEKALEFSIEYGTGLSLGRLTQIFEEMSKIDGVMLSSILELAIGRIFRHGSPEIFDNLVAQLQSASILDRDLVNFAFNVAFLEACKVNKFDLAKKYYHQAKILSWVYTKAMCASYDKAHGKNDVFNWLMDNAGGDDLTALLDVEESQFEKIREEALDRFLMTRHKLRKE